MKRVHLTNLICLTLTMWIVTLTLDRTRERRGLRAARYAGCDLTGRLGGRWSGRWFDWNLELNREGVMAVVTSTPAAPGAATPPRHPVLSLPLTQVMRSEIALPLQHVLQLYTVGAFLNAWRNPKNHKSIEQIFDTPQQARHAAAVCATWLGIQTSASARIAGAWWVGDDRQQQIDA